MKASDREQPEELPKRPRRRTGWPRSGIICVAARAPGEPRGTPDRELAGLVKLAEPADALKQSEVGRLGCDPWPDPAQRQLSNETWATTAGKLIDLIEHLVVVAGNVDSTWHLGEDGGLQALDGDQPAAYPEQDREPIP